MKVFKIITILVLAGAISTLLFIDRDADLRDPGELQELSFSMKNFSFNTFFEIAEEDENLFLSPYSIHTALTMAYRGADGDTAVEMAEVLGLTEMEMQKILEDSYGIKRYLESSQNNELSIANAFFLRQGIPFFEDYKSDGEKYFEAEIGELPESGEYINSWVSEKTREKIEEVIDDGPIDDDVIAYLVNAIYFRGSWAEEFDKDKTRRGDFQTPNGEVEVDMMENEAEHKYGISEDVQAVTIEYEDGDFLFHAFMPTEKSLQEFYEEFDSDYFQDIKPTNKSEIILRMPKFTLEDELGLVDTLESLGMEKPFDRNEADFSKMVDLEDLGLNVFISDVLHASFIEVDEEGTEAAAATAVEMSLESAPMPVEFDQPFLFVIEEPETETIIFIGQLIDPS